MFSCVLGFFTLSEDKGKLSITERWHAVSRVFKTEQQLCTDRETQQMGQTKPHPSHFSVSNSTQ